MPQISNATVRIAQSTLEQILQLLADATSPFHSRFLYLHSNIKENKTNLIHTLWHQEALHENSFAFSARVAFLIKRDPHKHNKPVILLAKLHENYLEYKDCNVKQTAAHVQHPWITAVWQWADQLLLTAFNNNHPHLCSTMEIRDARRLLAHPEKTGLLPMG